ncbi:MULTISPECIES: hypothetical protein [Sphaerochaeta]|jgi:hypothetical protein|uniref:Uncharacterized protein n=1 Tax=Sphaerochaeta associata TaxID=1129264 RepID=A0ABY4DI97_9SPIR|nr:MULTISPECIES: hypothetical protein [Sphaerochaeta]MDD2395307.1 hypothetical protein [Sphaerochaeta sp.]MDD3455329.1 hypothetical protein [Sphaerochaeta sp.]MDD4036802.1 hypothetical protein [Sphaerochaeta sp.]MDD4450130.1 hypothetical protein [Sphaerochaeta sp.]MDX9982712.1 hypothetical protein [Sphaerochaeta sp.]
MSENKHYGRQIILSLFLTVFLLLAVLYLASRFLLPLYDINQEMLYGLLVKLFPLLIGLVMIEIGVLVARRRDEDYADQVDKLPPNAYDKPFYTLPHDDPAHLHSDQLAFGQQKVESVSQKVQPVEIQEEKLEIEPVIKPVVAMPRIERDIEVQKVVEPAVAEEPVAEQIVYKTDFASILSVELDNSKDMDYDLTLVLIEVTEGPASLIANKLMMQSGELAYSFTLEGGRIAMVLPFYNADEARSFTLTMIESCKKEFSGSSLQIGFASRNGRMIDSNQLLHEAEAACNVSEN